MSKSISILTYCVYVILVLIVSFYLYKLFGVLSSSYYPVWSDEYVYYLNSKAFFLTSKAEAAFTFNGKGAKLGSGSAHGMFYYILHGSIAKIFGWHNYNIILTNYMLFFVSLFYLLRQTRIKIEYRCLGVLCILLFPFVPLYINTFMQEIIHVAFAVIVGIFLFKADRSHENKTIVTYLAIIFLAGLFRPLWFFYAICLLPFANTRKKLYAYIIIFVVSGLFSFLYVSLMTEHVPNFFSQIIFNIKKGNIRDASIDLTYRALSNFNAFLSYNGDLGNYFLRIINVILLVVFVIKYLLLKRALYLSVILIAVVNFVLLFTIYDAYDWRDVRSLAALSVVMLTIICLTEDKITLVTLALVFSPFFYSYQVNNPFESQRVLSSNKLGIKRNQLQSKFAKTNTKTPIVKLGFYPRDYSDDLLVLPLQTDDGTAIRYILLLPSKYSRSKSFIG